MNQYEIHIALDGTFSNQHKIPIFDGVELCEWPYDKQIPSAKVIIDAKETTEAQTIAIKKIELFLNLYYLCSFNALSISQKHQIDIKNIQTGEMMSTIKVHITPKKQFDQQDFFYILTNYFENIFKSKDEYLQIATSYFRRGRLDDYFDSKFIDWFIALESLYSKGEERTEMRFRLSNRIATMLGTTMEERVFIQDKFKKLYDLRSAVVHGSKSLSPNADTALVFTWLKESILRFLELSKNYSHDEIVSKIDNAMIDNKISINIQNESNTLVEKFMQSKS